MAFARGAVVMVARIGAGAGPRAGTGRGAMPAMQRKRPGLCQIKNATATAA